MGFVVDIKGLKTHSTVTQALQALENLDHRGAVGSDGLTGDGVGLLTQVPHLFFRKKLRARGVDVAADTDLAVGVFFFPGAGAAGGVAPGTDALIRIVDAALAEAGLEKLMWRTVRASLARRRCCNRLNCPAACRWLLVVRCPPIAVRLPGF